MKILTIKEYLKEKENELVPEEMSVDDMEKILTQSFIDILKSVGQDVNLSIIFNKDEQGCFCTKLYTKLNSSYKDVAIQIYNELLGNLHDQNLNQIVVKGLAVTPIITDSDMKNNTRGILAYLKYIK